MLGATLVRLNYVTGDQIEKAISDYLGLERIELSVLELPKEVVEKIPASIAQIYRLIPISFNKGELVVAQENALKVDQLNDINLLSGYKIKGVICNPKVISEAIEKYYPGRE